MDLVTGSRVGRAGPLASQAEAGNIDLVDWYRSEIECTEAFLKEAQAFDGVHGYSDQIDAAAGGYNKLRLAKDEKPAPLTDVTWGRRG